MVISARSYSVDEVVDLAPFKELLLRTCGHSFENEREQSLGAAVCRRMGALGVAPHKSYYDLLLRDQDELMRLTELLTVNETYFFREPGHLNMMVDSLLPEYMSARSQRPIRIVSAGCSTGEEPFTIAIMLRERFGAASERMFAITGVDIDSCVIDSAQQGLYSKNSFRGMEPYLLERYFKPCDSGRFQVRDSVKNMVQFEVVNLLGPSYPQRMLQPDIILYRNVSIYFPGQVQRDIFGRLADLLVEGGCLLVGASETFHHDVGILSLVKKDALFFYRKISTLVFEERRAARRVPEASVRAANRPVTTASASAAGTGGKKSRIPEARLPAGAPQPPAPLKIDVKASFDVALELAHSKQYDKALALLDAIIAQDDFFEKAYSLKGSLLLNVSRFDEAKNICSTILGRDPLCLEAYLMLGMIARQKGDNDEALKRFREALYLDASCWLAHFYTAEICFAQLDEKRSRSSYEATIRILEKGSLQKHGQEFFPLTFNAEQFIVICRHKLSLLAPQKG